MTKDYLDEIVSKFKLKELPKDRVSAFKYTYSELERFIVSFSQQLLPRAAAFAGVDRGVLKERLADVRLGLQPTINGRVITTDNWGSFSIEVNLGLMLFLHKMIKVFSSRSIGINENWQGSVQSSLPFEKVVSIANMLMTGFWDNSLLQVESLRIANFSDQQLAFHSNLLNNCELFTVSHELGHVILHISPNKIHELDVAEYFVEESISVCAQLDRKSSHQIRRWSEEIASDFIGWKLVLADIQERNQSTELAIASVELYFALIHMLEIFYQKNYNELPLHDSHLFGMFRHAALRLFTSDFIPPEIRFLGDQFFDFADQIVESTSS